ncbi:MAG: zf-TFIIB domain-containing protein [Candidatus Eremiobacteraeota bacterium]|nr:zf-TFIIB domain-containing protein [Candidatus Eremiobacteraeota bacterium]
MAIRCPACVNTLMTALRDEEISLEIDYCKKCKGLWFDYKEVRQFLKSIKFKKVFLPEVVSATSSSDMYSISTRVRTCPRCMVKLAEHVHCGVAFDFCDQCHGIFLDDGEINLIVAAYRKGKAGSDQVMQDELRAGFSRNDPHATSSIFNAIANFFKEFIESKGHPQKK